MKNFIMLWIANEKIIYKICNPEKQEYRSKTTKYATAVSPLYGINVDNALQNIRNASSRREVVDIVKNIQKGHYNGMNVDNVDSKDKDTIEFRLSNGSLNYEDIIVNIRLYACLMQKSKEVSIIQNKILNHCKISEEEENLYDNFGNLIGNDLGEEERAKKLISTVFEKEDSNEYFTRFMCTRKNQDKVNEMFNEESYKMLYENLKLNSEQFSEIISIFRNEKNKKDEVRDVE